MPEALFLGGFFHALDRGDRYRALAAHLDQQRADRDQRARLATVDDQRLQQAHDEAKAQSLVDSGAIARYLQSVEPPHAADLVEENPEISGGQPFDPKLLEKASPATGRAILEHQRRTEATTQTLGLRAQAMAATGEYRAAMLHLKGQGLDETEAHNVTMEHLREQMAGMKEGERAAKAEGYRAVARVLAADNPDLAAEFAVMADGGVNPVSAEQALTGRSREARLARGPAPSAAEKRVASMTEGELLAAASDPAAPKLLKVDAAITFRNRLPSLTPETLMELWKAAPPPARTLIEGEVNRRGMKLKKPALGGLFGGEATLSGTPTIEPIKAQSAHDEPLVPKAGKSPAQWVQEVIAENPGWTREQVIGEAKRRAGTP